MVFEKRTMNRNMIKLASPDIQTEDIQRLVEVLKSGNLVQGSYVSKLEKQIVDYTTIPNCVVVSSCTAALHLALMALGIGKGDAVIVPAFTFPATANVVEVVGAEVVLCDVDLTSYVVQPENIERIIKENKSKNIKAIIVVHEFGYPAEIKRIAEIAQKYGLHLIEDAACAFGTIANGHYPGYYSDMACYSFHPRKAITTGEGGAVLSSNDDLNRKIICLRNHGIEYKDGSMDFIYAGLNYRMTDFQAALAIGQLNRFDSELVKRKELANIYYDLLKRGSKWSLPRNHENHSWQSFMITLDKKIDRPMVIKKFAEKSVQTNLGAQAINCLKYYQKKYGFNINSHPIATILYEKGLVLPMYGKLNSTDVYYVADMLIKILG